MDSLQAIESANEDIAQESQRKTITENDELFEPPTLKFHTIDVGNMNFNTDPEDSWENILLDINNTIERIRQIINSNNNSCKLSALRKGKAFQHNCQQHGKSFLVDYDNSKSGGHLSYRSRSSFNVMSAQESNSIHINVEKIEEGMTTKASKIGTHNPIASTGNQLIVPTPCQKT